MKPNATLYDPRPEYLRELLTRAGVNQKAAAELLGLSPRQMRYYLSMAADHKDAPYCVQFALECLASVGQVEARVAELQSIRQEEHMATHRTLAAVIKASGGEISVKRHHVAAISSRTLIERHDSPGGDWFFKLREQ